MKSESRTLFTAIDLPEELKIKINQAFLHLKSLPFQWAIPENMHITLKYLGKTSKTQEKALIDKLNQIQSAPILIQIRQGSFFTTPKGIPAVLYLSIESPSLIQLAKQVEKASQETGFLPETRLYTPHLTLARIKKEIPPSTLKEYLHFSKSIHLNFTTHSFFLYESIPSASGSLYKKHQKFPLGLPV